jgi:Flp pilus assembly protein TadB
LDDALALLGPREKGDNVASASGGESGGANPFFATSANVREVALATHEDDGSVASENRLESMAAQAFHAAHLGVGSKNEQLLTLQGRSTAEFMASKLILAFGGAIAPALMAWVGMMLHLGWGAAPLGLSLVCTVGGFFLPDLQLRSTSAQTRKTSAAALSVYFDLVTLERLANASATQALTSAAAMGDAPLFRSISASLEHARMQQRAPWPELHYLAAQLGLDELHDIADIMALDEQGAALAHTLRARVRELRHAQLNADKASAQEKTEAMTVWMVLPVLAFALLFLTPPLLSLTGMA